MVDPRKSRDQAMKQRMRWSPQPTRDLGASLLGDRLGGHLLDAIFSASLAARALDSPLVLGKRKELIGLMQEELERALSWAAVLRNLGVSAPTTRTAEVCDLSRVLAEQLSLHRLPHRPMRSMGGPGEAVVSVSARLTEEALGEFVQAIEALRDPRDTPRYTLKEGKASWRVVTSVFFPDRSIETLRSLTAMIPPQGYRSLDRRPRAWRLLGPMRRLYAAGASAGLSRTALGRHRVWLSLPAG